MAVLSGGQRLEAFLADMSKKVSRPGTLRVGFLEGATYPDGTSVALVAATQNFGSKAIPPRPFFSNMIRDKAPGWPEKLGRLLQSTGYDGRRSLTLMGLGIEGQLRESIEATNAPPLAAATIAAKGFEKPLIDTSHMWNSINSEVKR